MAQLPKLGTVERTILREAGFVENVAYMPVPRCSSCKHWKPEDPADRGRTEIWGFCTNRTVEDLIYVFQGNVRSEFGCAFWEKP